MIEERPSQGKTNPLQLETLRTGRFSCLVDPLWMDRVKALLEAGEPASWADWTTVKQSTVRTIYRGDLPGPDGDPVGVHLKLFRAGRLSDRARDALSGSRSARECRNLVEARARGLPCVQPLVAGSYAGSCGSRSFLLTRTEPGEALPRGVLSPDHAAAAGRLLRQAHAVGLHARDLHAGNLLARPDGTIVMLDLTSAFLGEALDDDERARALAFFCLDLDGNVRDRRARPLIDAYREGYNESTALITAALKAGRRLRNRAVSAFGRRAFRPCRTTVVKHERRRARVFSHVPSEDLWPAAREAFDTLEELEPIKSGRRGAVYLTDTLAIKERTAAAARRLFESAYWLTFAGIPTPAPVALETFQSRGRIATRRLPHRDLLTDLRDGFADDTQALLACAHEFGTAVGRLHSFGLRNRDMKFENLIRDPGSHKIYMVDLDGIRRLVPADNRGRAGDLGRLLAAFCHAGRPGGDAVLGAFLRAYVRTCRRLLYPVPHRRHVLQRAEAAARRWATAHAS